VKQFRFSRPKIKQGGANMVDGGGDSTSIWDRYRNFAIGWGLLAILLAVVAMVAWRRPPQAGLPETKVSFTEVSSFPSALTELDRLIGAPNLADASSTPGHAESMALGDDSQLLRWTRRSSLALIGTIPSYQEIAWIRTADRSTVYEKWLDYLLSDRRHADYLAERFARAWVGTDNTPVIVFRRRRFVAWLSDQIAANVPYDQVARTLITADGVWTSSPEVNYITAMIDDDSQGNPNPARLAGRTMRAFMGVRLDCMECHDDNINGDWKQQDFHQLAAFFAPATSTLTGVRDKPRAYRFQFLNETETEEVSPRVPFRAELLETPSPELPRNSRLALANWLTHRHNRPFARLAVNRVWALLFGRGFVEPVDDIPLEIEEEPVFEFLVDDFIANNYDLRRLIRLAALSSALRSPSEDNAPKGLSSPHFDWRQFPQTRLRPDQIAGSILQASRLRPVTLESPALIRLISFGDKNDFLTAFGDPGADELSSANIQETLPRRLFMLNGKSVSDRTKPDGVANSSTQVSDFISDNAMALDTLFLMTLVRLPSPSEKQYFQQPLQGLVGTPRQEFFADLAWSLMNTTEFVTNK
jgi:Protein of unknown function (DUF1553)/Protein of unknown function (DUF1549)